MKRSFYIIVLGLCSCGGPLSNQKLPAPIFILAADAPSKPPELRSAGTEKAAPGEKACIKGACYVYGEAMGICRCWIKNPERDIFCSGSSRPECRLASPSCFLRMEFLPSELDQQTGPAREQLLASFCCNPGQDFMQWQEAEMQCWDEKTVRFWLHEPACDATCPPKGGEK